jgi:hypothetical protein
LNLPGFSLASGINSANAYVDGLGFAISTFGPLPNIVTRVKKPSVSYGTLRIASIMVCERNAISGVPPSNTARSTTTCALEMLAYF